MSYPRTLVLAALCAVALPAAAQANGNVYVSRFWHNHQPIYWPEWNGNGSENGRVQYAWDSIVMKPGQNYGGISPAQHPENNLTDIFGLDDRRNSYQSGPRNSLTGFDSRGGFAISYSGSLIDNVRQLGGVGQLGYGGGWNNGYREARGWNTPSGSTRMDLVGFTYHHSLAPLLPKSVFRKELQTFKQAWWKAWGGNSDLSDHSKGFFPTEMGYSRHLIDVLVEEGYQWVIVGSHHISRTCPTYFDQFDIENGSYGIYSSPPNRADQLGPSPTSGWWYGEPNPGNAAWNVSPYAYQLHRVKYVDPETGAEKKMIAVPSDDVLSYRYGYANEGIGKINDEIAPFATDPNRPVIVMPSTDGDNAWGGGSSSWFEATPQLFNESANAGYNPTTPQDFVNAHGAAAQDAHIEDGAWIFPESCYGSPNFLKWIEPPVVSVANRYTTAYPGTQVDMETPGFALKFFSYAPLMAGANWLETAEQILSDENGGNDMVNEWKVAHPYNWDGSWTSPNDVELAWHIYLNGLDSGFNYYGGLGNDDEVKPALATKNAIDRLQGFMTPERKANDRTPPTVLKPQRFPYNPGAYTFGWFNYQPGGDTAYLKKNPSWFYIWTHAYDLSGIPDGNVKLKIRVDNDGVNPLATNQNETYAGGSEVGEWITVEMTKRVLPKTRDALNAAAANGQIDYFVFDPAFWSDPIIADYYFAKIDDNSVPDFRDKLLDYYIEATDSKGNIHKSEIQHVWVANDGETPSSGVQFSPNPSDCEPITVTYTAANGPLENLSPVTMQISFDGGDSWTPYTMNGGNNVWTYPIDAPDNAPSATVYFESGATIDSRNGQNWSTSIRDCEAPDGPVWTDPFTPVAGQPVTVYYDPAGRPIASATEVNIHYGYNRVEENWTALPGMAMTKSGDIWSYTYTVPADATEINIVFNNNQNGWDNNGGADWNLAVNDNPPAEVPAAPSGLRAEQVAVTGFTLLWDRAETASSYKILRDGEQVALTDDNVFVDTALTPKTTYEYTIVATNVIGDSPASAPLEVTTLSNPLLTDEILILDPVGSVDVTSATYRFEGRAGAGFTSGLTWTNAASGVGGTIDVPVGDAANGWDWFAEVSLAAGLNTVTFSGTVPTAGTQDFSDTPMNYTAFVSGEGQGEGFGVWYFNHSAADAGSFLANTTDHGNMNVGTEQGFGLYANNGGRAAITRSFDSPMKSGDSFNVKFDNNWLDNGAKAGLELRDAEGVVRFRFFFVGGETTYRVEDAEVERSTSTAYTEGGLDLTLTLGEGDAYTFNTGSGEFTGDLKSGGPIVWVEFFNENAGPDTERNVYIGEMTHTVVATGERTVDASASVTRSGTAYGDWLGEEVSSDAMLLKYAIGGSASPGEEGQDPQMSHEGGDFVLTVMVRDDDALAVTGKTTDDLAGSWTTNGVRTVEPEDQSAAPVGCKVVEYRVPADGDHRFLRLEVTHTP